MELKEALWKRRCVRQFTDEPVTDAEIREILEAAMSGPSACNFCPWEFYVVTSPGKLSELRGASPYSNYAAPVAIVPAGNTLRIPDEELKDFWIQDLSAAAENLMLRATDLGLGSVWCGIWSLPDRVADIKDMLKLPEHTEPLGIFYVGHPAEAPLPRTQFEEDRVHYLNDMP